MFTFIEKPAKQELLVKVELPEGKTQKELVSEAKKELKQKSETFFGKHILINGRITTGMALMMGHELAHISKSVAIFDPKENDYIVCIKH